MTKKTRDFDPYAFLATIGETRSLCFSERNKPFEVDTADVMANRKVLSADGERPPGMRSDRCDAATEEAMSRQLVWIDQKRFRGFGCSECGWRFTTSGRPAGTSFDEMMRIFELQRDKEFMSHVCADHSKSQPHEEQKR